MVESEEPSSNLGHAPSYSEILVHRMESTAGTEHVEGFRGSSLGTGNIPMAQAFKILMDHGLFAMRGLCAMWPWMHFAT